MGIVNILKQNIKYICKYWLKCVGILTGILSILFIFISWEDIGVNALSQKVILLYTACLLLLFWAVLWICVLKKKKIIWQCSSGKIIVCYADILKEAFETERKEERLYVIPVNSAFDTIVDSDVSQHCKPLVSPKSLHGKWIKKMEELGMRVEDIDNEITHSLETYNIIPINTLTENQKERGKRKVYELGTTAVVKGKKNNTFILLAITNFDNNNNAQLSEEQLEDVMKKLLLYYNRHGQGYELFVPLMGTGLSRANISHDESLRIITSRLMLYKKYICGDISVVIYPRDKDKVTIDI